MADICPRPLDCSETHGRLEIAGWSLHTGAWCAWDLSPVIAPVALRLENVPVEKVPGRPTRPGLADETDRSLSMMFSGAVDRAGVPWPDPRGGLQANLDAAVAQWITPIRNGVADLPALLWLPQPADGVLVSRATDVQPLDLDWEIIPGGYARAVLTLRLASGGFV